jgi:hypothetical protein
VLKNNNLAFLFCFIALKGFCQDTVLVSDALNKAMQQSMLCERMAKNYLLNSSNIIDTEEEKELKKTTVLFSANLYELTIFAKNPETKTALQNVSNLWIQFRTKVYQKPQLKEVPTIVTEATTLSNACKMVFKQLQSENDVEMNNLIKISAQERLASQQLAKLYLMNYWKVPHDTQDQEFEETITNFERLMTKLLSAKENTPEINSILKRQNEGWKKLKQYLLDKEDRLLLNFIFEKTNTMFADFDQTTQLYNKLFNK